MLNFILRAPYTFVSLAREASRNSNFSLSEKIQAFVILSGLFLRQRFHPQATETIQTKIFNFKVKAYNYPTLIFLFREIFLTESYHFNADSKTPVIIDGGANIGMSVLYFKFLYPESRIVAFEPNPEALDLLRQNLEMNRVQNVTLIPSGLGSRNDEMTFFLDGNKGGLEASFHKENAQQQLKVRMEKLSGYIKIHEPDLVKLDVEGAETGIVEELVRADVLAIPKHYIIEYHQPQHSRKTAFAPFLQTFTDAGFLYWIRDRDTASATEDQLVYFYK